MSAVLSSPDRPAATPWRQALPALGLLLAAIVLLYLDTFVAMVAIWSRSGTFAHAYLVPPISLWLIWRRRETLAACTPRPLAWVLLPMAMAAAGWLLGDLAGVNAVTQLCATALLVLAVPAVLGWNVTRHIVFPLCFLFFMVPIGEFLIPLMMEATADFTVAAVSMSGVPVYREGQQFIIPSGSWSVVEACSGVRYLIASFMVGTLFAYLNFSTLRRRLAFGLVSILVPVLANWLRAYMIVMLGHLSGNTLAVGVDHIIYGWVFFGVVIMLMFLVGARWSEPEVAPTVPSVKLADGAEVSAMALWAVALAAATLLALPPAAAWRANAPEAAVASALVMPALPGTSPAADQVLPVTPEFPGATARASRVYEMSGAGAVAVHIAYYQRQGYGAKVSSSNNVLVHSNDKYWNTMTGPVAEVGVQGQTVALRAAELVGGGTGSNLGRRRLDVRQVYWIGGHYTADDQWATVLSLWSRVSGHGGDGAVITFFAEGDKASTTARLNSFISSELPGIGARLAAMR